ncbi:MAG: hypothetical protein GXW85_10155 [Clostridia bacterium]|nr:hypothetical protein [Clostridia bacterium]
MNKKTVVLLLLIFCFFMGETVLAQEQDLAEKTYQFKNISFSLPASYQKDTTKFEDIALSFSGSETTLRVFIQPLNNQLTVDSYINYGNKQLELGKANFKIIEKRNYVLNEYKVVEIAYYRPLIPTIEKDQNFYRELHLFDAQENRVITFWAKTVGANYVQVKNELNKAARSLTRLTYYTPNPFSAFTFKNKPIVYEGEKIRLEIPVNKVLWGRFYPEVPFSDYYYQQMLNTEKSLNHKFEFIMTYKNFPNTGDFPAQAIKRVYDEGRVLMLTLQPFTPDLNWIAIPEIVAGVHDAKIREWALGLKNINEPVFVRPFNEMNGDWDPWCAWFFGKDTDLYIQAWRHFVDIFREVGANNVLFVWNPHDRSYPDFVWNNAHLYYPGDDYVDWVGLTGYNNGTSHPGDVWREFDEIYEPLYFDYLKRYSDKPFMITEFSSNEIGGDKAAWLEKGMASLATKYPNIKIATWFDGRDGLWQYELNSSPAAWESFKKGLTNEGFIKGAVTKKSD